MILYVYVYVHTYVYIYIYNYKYKYMYVYMSMYRYMCLRIRIRTSYMHIFYNVYNNLNNTATTGLLPREVCFDCTRPVFYAFWDVGRRRITQMAHAPNLQSTAPSFSR